MKTTAIDDAISPRSMQNVVQEVTEYVIRHTPEFEGRMQTRFEVYDDALHAIWPELYKASPKAHLLVGLSIYVEIANRWGFEVPPSIREMIL